MTEFAAYGHALVSIALFALIILALSPLCGLAKGKAGLAPGATPESDYTSSAYRLNRAYLNATETMPVFAAVTLAAIFAGASPFWVNLLASIFLLSRILMLVLHLRGVGSPHQGPRTFAYVAGWLCMGILAVMAACAAF